MHRCSLNLISGCFQSQPRAQEEEMDVGAGRRKEGERKGWGRERENASQRMKASLLSSVNTDNESSHMSKYGSQSGQHQHPRLGNWLEMQIQGFYPRQSQPESWGGVAGLCTLTGLPEDSNVHEHLRAAARAPTSSPAFCLQL